jgi:surfeit locus 1 family protein
MTRRMIAPLIFGICGVAILVGLGIWQVQRLAWKAAILDRIEARLAAAPVEVPPDPTPAADQYRRVRAAGTIAPGELHVYAPAPGGGAGYRVIAPLVLGDGRRVLLDRGFVPVEAKDAPRALGPATVVGSLLWPQESDRFTSPPDRAGNVWFARDVPLMAEALGALPVMLVAEPGGETGAPAAMPVSASIPNNHLEYAVTWFAMALAWAVMTGYLLWRIKRRTL